MKICKRSVVLLGAAFSVYSQPIWSSKETEAASAAGSTYVVKKHDTLWDLARQHLNDPFRWPDIWHLNRHIQNPDLIYPGDRLVLPAAIGGYGATPDDMSAGEARPAAGLSPPDFADLTKGLYVASMGETQSALDNVSVGVGDQARQDSQDNEGYLRFMQSLISKNYFSPQYREKVGFLWFEKDAKGRIAPGTGSVTGCSDTSVFRQYDRVEMSFFGGKSLQVNDTVDIFRCDRMVKFKNALANLVRRIGRGRIVWTDGQKAQAELFRAWDVVRCGDRVAPVQRFAEYIIDTIHEVEREIEAQVFQRVETTESPFLYHCFIIDCGEVHGVRLGDIFAVYPAAKKTPKKDPSILACAVHVGRETATLSIVRMFANELTPGDKARLIKRIRFKEG